MLAKCVNLPKVVERIIERQVRVTDTKESKPEKISSGVLKSALILPFPPENKNRILLYESYETRNVDGTSMVIFREFRDGSFTDTTVPEANVRWGVATSER